MKKGIKEVLQIALEEADDYSYVLTQEQAAEHRGAKYALYEVYQYLFDESYQTERDKRLEAKQSSPA